MASIDNAHTVNNSAVESVWDYPRPPRLEPSTRHVQVVHAGAVIADSQNALRILETSHPPVFYIPQADIAMQHLVKSGRRSTFCEWKGYATYWSIRLPGGVAEDVAWSYAAPAPPFADLRDHLAFYASRVDRCTVDDEVVAAQPGDFYGGWITSHVCGPFKGSPGTMGW